ncbi:heme-binding protein [Mucilaginibacter sp. AW1-3]
MATIKNLAATPLVFNRKANGNNSAYGPLQTLINGNTWVGDTGFNLMVVPNPKSQFLVMVSQLFETHNFEEVPAPVPNRSQNNGTAQVGAVKYSQIVAENVSKNILHEETGMWLNQTLGTLPTDPTGNGLQAITGQPETDYVITNPVVRSGTIPHGNTIQATGVWTDYTLSTPIVPGPIDLTPYIAINNFPTEAGALSFLPYFVDQSDPTALQADYRAQIAVSLDNIGQTTLTVDDFVNPISLLNKYTSNISEIVSMAVTTANDQGGVLNVPFARGVIGPQDFICTFMIETVQNNPTYAPTQDENPTFFQLQYLQSIPLLFPKAYNGKDVVFPHWNINTLIAI